MWKVYKTVIIDDPKYGKRTVEFEECEGSKEYCEAYAANHPDTYVSWYCF